MDALIKYIVVPLVIGVATPFIVEWVRSKRDQPILSPRERILIGGAAAVAIAVVLLVLPPYNISSVSWCTDANQSVKVTGRLTTNLLGTPVGDGEMQVKIFGIGQDRPLFPEKFARTTADGTFATNFPSVAQTERGYLVNIAYKRFILNFLERWEINDFRMGDLESCVN